MATDEAVFRESQCVGGPPTLRFFGWNPPAVSVGFFQDLSAEIDVESCRTNRVDIVRRITGGKAVLHQNEITYSLIGSESCTLFPPGLQGRYKAISEALAIAFSVLGIRAEMEESRVRTGGDLKEFCFSVPAQYELLVHGKKICGSAQASSHGSFLQHGSILIDFDPVYAFNLMTRNKENKQERIQKLGNSITGILLETGRTPETEEFLAIMIRSFELKFGIRLLPGELTESEALLRTSLLHDKYLSNLWNMKAKTDC